ncbi:MAG: metallophosphoesterase [Verrucomicrobiota bacterium]|nr:metallophosphoesterase [Verrucomicrobiota bacterium]
MNRNKPQYEIAPNVWLDPRRAVFLEKTRTLAVADLHLGYVWAHRVRGQMMPLLQETTLARLLELISDYQPKTLALLGDIVHETVSIHSIRQTVEELVNELCSRIALVLVTGNHDRDLQRMLPGDCIATLKTEFIQEKVRFIHGDQRFDPCPSVLLTVLGHEHPAFRLGDGVATSARFPCFLWSADLLVLPAFSEWAAGCVLGSAPFLSPGLQNVRFQQAIVIMGNRLLPIPLL